METINIKGTEYIPVNERIKEFWKRYPDGNIITELVTNENGVCVIKANIYVNGDLKTTGYAYEKESSSFINKTSYIENCETSAIGRALGILGIGIDASVASAEEVENAMENQKKIDATHASALEKAIMNKNLPSDVVVSTLAKFGYKAISEITVGDYMNVVNAFKEAK